MPAEPATPHPLIIAAAEAIADSNEVQQLLHDAAGRVAMQLEVEPLLAAAAIADRMAVPLREDVARGLITTAQLIPWPRRGVTAVRREVAELLGFSSHQAAERRWGLVGEARRGRHGWTPAQLGSARAETLTQDLYLWRMD